MIQSLERAFGILQILAEKPETHRGLAEIADRIGLNRSTCANLLKTLVGLGYAEQAAPRRGYIPGPMVYYLARSGPYRKDIISPARPILAKLAHSLSETALIATFRMGKRFVLCQVDGNSVLTVRDEYLLRDDIYKTSTGRLLIASLSGEELASFVQLNGLPDNTWPGVRSLEDLKRELAVIAREKIVVTPGPTIGIAVPIFEDRSIVAALGVFLPSSRFDKRRKTAIIAEMRRTAGELTAIFSHNKGVSIGTQS